MPPIKPTRPPAEILRCGWVDLTKPDYVAYHDEEWGVPVFDDQRLFEFLTLESAQAGLSWYTVLRKRDHYRKAFADFDPVKVARFGPRHVERLLQNAGLIRNRMKLEAAVHNSRQFLRVQSEFGTFAEYMWGFVNGQPIVNRWSCVEECPPTSAVSDALSKDLKQRGFKFVGSTVCYAHMQATGMVLDHLTTCFRYEQVRTLHRSLTRRATSQRRRTAPG
jgi:DNA-3-methyladenine glycosylase I